MTKTSVRLLIGAVLMALCAARFDNFPVRDLFAQDIDPFPKPIAQNGEPARVNITEFAAIPDVGGDPARMMLLVNEPGTRRLFVNDMRGPLYSVSYDGRTVVKYLDINATNWGVSVQSQGRERGFQSFAFHPQFAQAGARGYGKFYTYTDSSNMQPKPDFLPAGGMNTHDTVLFEWTAKNPAAATYDGGPPREIVRFRQPFANHNGGLSAFNPLATQGSADYGLLYFTLADGGSGGDPFNAAQNLGTPFGKMLRVDPLGNNSANGKYGIPASNPFVGKRDALGEIYLYGVRNPQRFGWDPKNGALFVAEIGQNIVEEVSVAGPGANLGWHDWEASFRFIDRTHIELNQPRADPKVTYPFVEFDHHDPLFGNNVAVTGVIVYRGAAIAPLANKVIVGDNPSGEVFYVDADSLPKGGQDAIRRVLFNSGGSMKTLLQLIREKNAAQKRPAAERADLRFGTGPENRVFLLNKQDGVIRELRP
jgi:glucose/sorbosone dehydrogenase